MNKASLCLFGGALLGAGLSSTAHADLSYSGELSVLDSYDSGYGYDKVGLGYSGYYSFNYGLTEIHTFNFSVISSGDVVIDALSWAMFNTFTDTQLRLFHNDGKALSSDNHIAENDDYGYDYNFGSGYEINDFNGSISTLDSFMDLFLEAGDYTVAIGGLWFSEDDANNRAGIGTSYSDPFSIPNGAEYQLDIIGDVRPTVPAPGALALLGLGTFVGARRRR